MSSIKDSLDNIVSDMTNSADAFSDLYGFDYIGDGVIEVSVYDKGELVGTTKYKVTEVE